MKSFTFPPVGSENDFDLFLKQFDECFIPQKNIIHKGAQFYQRLQKPDENVENFIWPLYELAEMCKIKQRKNETIRGRLVVGKCDEVFLRSCSSLKTWRWTRQFKWLGKQGMRSRRLTSRGRLCAAFRRQILQTAYRESHTKQEDTIKENKSKLSHGYQAAKSGVRCRKYGKI